MNSKRIQIKSASQEQRVRNYLGVLYKFHKLTDKEIDILVILVLEYYKIITKYPVHDQDLISKLLFSTEVRNTIKDKLSLKNSVLYNYFNELRKKNVIKGKVLNPSFIPSLETFELTFEFI